MATIRQKKAFKAVLKGSTISGAMVKAGYSATTATTTGKLTKTKGWNELMQQHIPDSSLAEAHREMLEQKEVNYFVFPKLMTDEEITEHVESNGLEVINICPSDKGKLAFYSIINANARKSALDMAYKLKGKYAPDKTLNLNVEVDASPEIKELAKKINDVYRGEN